MIETGVRSDRGTGQGDLWHRSPTAGELPANEIAALAAVLAEHTTTPEDCYFGFWEGLGMIGVPVDHPRLTLPSCEHLLFRGTVADAGRELHGFTPSVWWPADRAWFVASDVDLTSTYIGGPTALMNALYGEVDRFEAVGSWRGAQITWDCDTVNPRAAGPYTYGLGPVWVPGQRNPRLSAGRNTVSAWVAPIDPTSRLSACDPLRTRLV